LVDRQERPLGSFEEAQAITGQHFPYNLVAVIGLEGLSIRDRLRGALDGLQHRHPLLRSHITWERKRPCFRIGADEIPLRFTERRHDRAWIELVEEELVTAFDSTRGPLARCAYLPPPEGEPASEVVITFHHAIVDGVAAGRFAHDLLSACGGSAPEEKTEVSSVTFPVAADEHFPARFRGARRLMPSALFLGGQLIDEAAFRWRTRGQRARPDAGAGRCRIYTMIFSEAETDAIVRASRRRRVTLTGLFEAAILLAVLRHRYPGKTLPHRYFAFPLLRPYLEPPISDESFGSYLTTLRLTIEASDKDDIWDLASRIHRQLHEAAKAGEKFLASLSSPFSMRTVFRQQSCRMSTTALSYTGPARLDSHYGDLRLRELHAFVSNFAIGPEYTAQVRLFRRKLWWDILYLEADMDEQQARGIADDIHELLVTATRSPAGGKP
jgi:hypothetical protein